MNMHGPDGNSDDQLKAIPFTYPLRSNSYSRSLKYQCPTWIVFIKGMVLEVTREARSNIQIQVLSRWWNAVFQILRFEPEKAEFA